MLDFQRLSIVDVDSTAALAETRKFGVIGADVAVYLFVLAPAVVEVLYQVPVVGNINDGVDSRGVSAD